MSSGVDGAQVEDQGDIVVTASMHLAVAGEC